MKETLLLKLGKIALKTGVKVLKFSFKIALVVFFGYTENKRINNFRKWQDDYDEYAKSITHHEPF
jgi:hypothetical protein